MLDIFREQLSSRTDSPDVVAMTAATRAPFCGAPPSTSSHVRVPPPESRRVSAKNGPVRRNHAPRGVREGTSSNSYKTPSALKAQKTLKQTQQNRDLVPPSQRSHHSPRHLPAPDQGPNQMSRSPATLNAANRKNGLLFNTAPPASPRPKVKSKGRQSTRAGAA